MNISLTHELGKGGEATVYNIAEDEHLVAKIYHQPTSDREAKLRAMLLNPPEQPSTHMAIAWPTALVYQHTSGLVTWSTLETLEATNMGQFVGFLMPKITAGCSLFHIYNPVLRKQLPYPFDRKALHRTAYNLCAVVAKIHAKGYVIGDINESNILVNREALVTIVDCDSFQVKDEAGHIHRCQVGKPEYTPPELQGMRLSEVDQTIQHDLFGLAVLLFQLLMEGYHPFTGVLQTLQSVGRVDLYAIREGLFPYDNNVSHIDPPPSAPPYHWLHPRLQARFGRCFVTAQRNVTYRPTAWQWQEVLHQAERNLQQCSKATHDYFANHLPACPFCEKVAIPSALSYPPNRKRRNISLAFQPFSRPTQLFTWNINNNGVNSIAFSGDGRIFATTNWDQGNGVVYWSPAGQQKISWYGTKDICFSPQQIEILLMGSYMKGLAIWNMQTNSLNNNQFEKCPTSGVHKVAFTPNGNYFACYHSYKDVYVWQMSSSTLPIYKWMIEIPKVVSFSFSRDSQFLMTGGRDKGLTLRRITDGVLIRSFETPSPINQIVCSPVDDLVATAHSDNTIRIWHLLTGQLIRTLNKHVNKVTAIAFSPDGRLLASGGLDSHIQVWRLADKMLLQTLHTHTKRINRVTFSPDGKFLASAGEDGRVCMWGANTV